MVWLSARDKKRKTELLYLVERLRPHRDVADAAWRLRKENGEAYDVTIKDGDWSCQCWDWLHRRDGRDPQFCKHVRAVIEGQETFL